jgi:hypothetical protein
MVDCMVDECTAVVSAVSHLMYLLEDRSACGGYQPAASTAVQDSPIVCAAIGIMQLHEFSAVGSCY